MTEREKAILEAQIWNTLYEIEGTGFTKKCGRREDWFKSALGGSGHEYAIRNVIFNSGSSVAELLWDRIDNKKMPMRTAQRLLVNARKIVKKDGIDFKDAIISVLKSYDESDGYFIRSSKGGLHKVSAPYSKKAEKKKADNSAEFKRQIRILTEEFIEFRLGDVDEYQKKKLTQTFTDWISTGVDELLVDIQKLRSEAKREKITKIGARRFSQACEILGIRAVFGKPIDVIAIKKATHTRVTRGKLHPDINGGDEAKTKEFHAVIEARETLDEYMEQLKEINK